MAAISRLYYMTLKSLLRDSSDFWARSIHRSDSQPLLYVTAPILDALIMATHGGQVRREGRKKSATAR